MSDINDFQPYTPQLGIVGSSYQLQMGKVNKYWAVRLVKGRDVLASKVFKDVPNPEKIPLGNQITGWILSVLAIPNLNTYQIQKTVGFIRQKAQQTMEDQEKMKQSAGKSESTETVLEKVPENVQIKRPQARGWVKEDESAKMEEIPEEIAEISPGLVQRNEEITGKSQGTLAHLRSKQLRMIPKGEGFEPKPFVFRQRGTATQGVAKAEFVLDKKVVSELDLLKRQVQELEKRVSKLEYENAELRAKLG